MKDSEIVALFLERSERAITELICKYEVAIRKVASNILGNTQDVEECVNDAFLQVWDTIPPQQPNFLGAYSCRIARNLALNRYHANTAKKRNSFYDAALDELEDCVPALSNVETEYDARELTEYINHFLATLPYSDRYLFVRRYWYADSVSDIACAMQLKPHAVSVRLSRLREKLQNYLIREGMLA